MPLRGTTFNIISRRIWGFPARNEQQQRRQRVKRYREMRIVGYSAEQMFEIVNGVHNYPYFVPWCKETKTHRVGERVAEYELCVGFPPFKERYTSRVTILYPTVIHAVCTKGSLFDVFDTTWRFGPGPGGLLSKNQCTILFTMEFQFKNAAYASMSGVVFNWVAAKMVEAFLKRAEQIHGPAADIGRAETTTPIRQN